MVDVKVLLAKKTDITHRRIEWAILAMYPYSLCFFPSISCTLFLFTFIFPQELSRIHTNHDEYWFGSVYPLVIRNDSEIVQWTYTETVDIDNGLDRRFLALMFGTDDGEVRNTDDCRVLELHFIISQHTKWWRNYFWVNGFSEFWQCRRYTLLLMIHNNCMKIEPQVLLQTN